MAIDQYTVSGCAFVYVGTGTASALELLGYTESGVDMDIKENKREIMTDLYGDMTPQDFQDMGMIANLASPLIAMDGTVLSKVMGRGDHTGTGVAAAQIPEDTGKLNTPGLVLGIGGYAFPIVIASNVPRLGTYLAGQAWKFHSCLTMNEETRLATKANPFKASFMAWPYAPFTATTGKDVRLWSRVNQLN